MALLAAIGIAWLSLHRPALHTPAAPDSMVAPLPRAVIHINSASAAEISLLPGVGMVLAERIVADRERNGPFASPEDLQRVPGIGPRTAERMIPLVSFEIRQVDRESIAH